MNSARKAEKERRAGDHFNSISYQMCVLLWDRNPMRQVKMWDNIRRRGWRGKNNFWWFCKKIFLRCQKYFRNKYIGHFRHKNNMKWIYKIFSQTLTLYLQQCMGYVWTKRQCFESLLCKHFPGEKCLSNCAAILETSDKAASTLLTDVWPGGGYSRLQKRECLLS